jgi:hypothetical protein
MGGRPAADWIGKGGRACKLRDAGVTAKGQLVGAVVCVHARAMRERWCPATSDADALPATLVNHGAWRRTIEPQFRDARGVRFGMGLSATRIGEPARRNQLLLVSAFAVVLLTLYGIHDAAHYFNCTRAENTVHFGPDYGRARGHVNRIIFHHNNPPTKQFVFGLTYIRC